MSLTTSAASARASAQPCALIVGATGGFGAQMARTLLAQGWAVHALTRHADMASRVRSGSSAWCGLEAVQWHLGDASVAADVLQAAQGACVIVHAANPPRYQRWRELALPMLANSVAAAREVGARVVLPGNIYNFGPDAGHLLGEASPQHPLTSKGAVRVEMEQMLHAAGRDHARPVRSLVIRAGDFFGGHSPASWFGNIVVKPGRPLRQVVYPGAPGVGHSWAYLPDVTQAVALLLALDQREPQRLATSEVAHFEGHWLEAGDEIAHAIRHVSGQPDLPIKRLPWWVLQVASPVVPLFREILEMRYLWRVPLRLDNRKLRSLIGHEPHTPLDEAVRASLIHMGCLSPAAAGDETEAEQAASAAAQVA
ncbi:NAD-dependent epimerase/dehydratase family protein [Aquabacterium sp. NJ1]|uniref:NAD-dependent epimerase/dehydratase family protein n=1 Tax=Aquabacterium sp. NJ1 TaxID=1538295 RepID=UPI00068EEC8F|nr:NAD-dependent epimerase/dehydratase family protein [Aquabacterium sp. NJ1]